MLYIYEGSNFKKMKHKFQDDLDVIKDHYDASLDNEDDLKKRIRKFEDSYLYLIPKMDQEDENVICWRDTPDEAEDHYYLICEEI